MNTTVSQPVNQPELEQFFDGIDSRLAEHRITSESAGQKELEFFFTAISRRIKIAKEEQVKLDRKKATRFNVFDLIEPDENRLSDVLGFLLDPKGKHGQGDLFLRLLFERLEIGLSPRQTADARVQREAPTYKIRNQRRRMDVLVEAGVLLAIENKVDSAEQENQVKDYLEHLARCASVNQQQNVLIYLTPDDRPPEMSSELEMAKKDGRLRCWNYQRELRDWLADCCQQCVAKKIQYFLADFISYIETQLKRENLLEQTEKTDEK